MLAAKSNEAYILSSVAAFLTSEDPAVRDLDQAVRLAERAVETNREGKTWIPGHDGADVL